MVGKRGKKPPMKNYDAAVENEVDRSRGSPRAWANRVSWRAAEAVRERPKLGEAGPLKRRLSPPSWCCADTVGEAGGAPLLRLRSEAMRSTDRASATSWRQEKHKRK